MCCFASVGHDETLLGEVGARSSYEFQMSADRDCSLEFRKKTLFEDEKTEVETILTIRYIMRYIAR